MKRCRNYLEELGYARQSLRADSAAFSFVLQQADGGPRPPMSASATKRCSRRTKGAWRRSRPSMPTIPLCLRRITLEAAPPCTIRPRGFRRVKHILIAMDDADAYRDQHAARARRGRKGTPMPSAKRRWPKSSSRRRSVRDYRARRQQFDDIMAHNSDDPGSTEKGTPCQKIPRLISTLWTACMRSGSRAPSAT